MFVTSSALSTEAAQTCSTAPSAVLATASRDKPSARPLPVTFPMSHPRRGQREGGPQEGRGRGCSRDQRQLPRALPGQVLVEMVSLFLPRCFGRGPWGGHGIHSSVGCRSPEGLAPPRWVQAQPREPGPRPHAEGARPSQEPAGPLSTLACSPGGRGGQSPRDRTLRTEDSPDLQTLRCSRWRALALQVQPETLCARSRHPDWKTLPWHRPSR